MYFLQIEHRILTVMGPEAQLISHNINLEPIVIAAVPGRSKGCLHHPDDSLPGALDILFC